MIDLLQQHVANGIVRAQSHPTLPLTLYNYAERCQYERLWDDVTLQCRGLVMHGSTVVARPFRKFFNDHEHAEGEIPWHLPCEITEKLDGSLLILFAFDGQWIGATRGSFCSEQAIIGGDIVQQAGFLPLLDPALTYLWEVIYPQNRIVLDYGGRRECVLLAMIETATGRELPLSDAPQGVPVVRCLPRTANPRELREVIRDDEEGYVVRFANGFRVKVKGAKYVELHKLVSGISSRSVWETLAEGKSFDELLAVVPDEFGDWVRSEKESLEERYAELRDEVNYAVVHAAVLATRKEQAAYILANHKEISAACFAALDGRDTSGILWRQLYPEFRRPERMVEVLA